MRHRLRTLLIVAQPRVKAYVHNQVEHHKKWQFTDEFRALLERHGIPYEERYLWV